MGLNDTAEQFASAQQQSVRDEARIRDLERALRSAAATIASCDASIEGLARQNAELEHDLARAESALADRLQPADGILLTPEEAALAARAARHSAESIRAVLDVDPTRLHPDVAGYVARLTDLADRLQADA